jgi:hypothetical protein
VREREGEERGRGRAEEQRRGELGKGRREEGEGYQILVVKGDLLLFPFFQNLRQNFGKFFFQVILRGIRNSETPFFFTRAGNSDFGNF